MRSGVSNDGMSWTSFFTQSAGRGGVENLTFVPVSARYVCMYGTARATQYGYSLYVFEVYGPNTAPTITTQPANQRANVGSTATFTVAAAPSPTNGSRMALRSSAPPPPRLHHTGACLDRRRRFVKRPRSAM
jgi:hypothetical protein